MSKTIDKYNEIVYRIQQIDQMINELSSFRETLENQRIDLAIEISKEIVMSGGNDEK